MAETYVSLYPFEKDLKNVVAGVPINYKAELDMLQMQMKTADKKDIPGMLEYEKSLRAEIAKGNTSSGSTKDFYMTDATKDWLSTGNLPANAPLQKAQDAVTNTVGDFLSEKVTNISFIALGGLTLLLVIGFTAYNSIKEG